MNWSNRDSRNESSQLAYELRESSGRSMLAVLHPSRTY
jgi:hypothetical protein